MTKQKPRTPVRSTRLILRARSYALTIREEKFANELAADHRHIRIYRSGGGVCLSRDAMYTPGLRETFWVRTPKKQNTQAKPPARPN